MQRLAASLLALTRASPSQAEPDKLQRTPFDLSDLVRRCIPPLNVVRNAVDHCPAGSDIRIETRSEDGEALILVTDDGPGVAAGDQSGAFDRFERHSRGSRQRGQGGSIRLQSVPAGGCLFEYAFIESADIDPTRGGPGPNPAQLRAEIWQAIIHGVRGTCYFPEQVGAGIPFLYDVTPADVAAEMTRQNATITQLAGVLQGPINPSGLSASVPAPLEAAWRSSSSGKYFFVLNLSNASRSAQTLSFSGIGAASSASVYGENRTVAISNGRITDDFGPYAVHIYQIP